VTLAAAGQNPQAPKPATGTGVIAGRVVEAGSQTPVAEAIVNLSGPPDPVAHDFGERRRVMVDPQGRFVFTGLPPGTYRLSAVQFGYLTGWFETMRPLTGDPMPIDLADGQRFTDATIPMWRPGSISGRVVDEAGEPVVGVRIVIFQRAFRNGEPGLAPAFPGGTLRSFLTDDRTDDRGIYRAALLPPGEYSIAVPAAVSTFPVDVIRDAQTSNVNLGVVETAPLGDSRNLQIGNLILTTMSQAPIPPARDGGPLTVYETTFHPDTTSADQAVVIKVAPGENHPGVDIRLVAKPSVRVSGRVVGPDGPLPLTPFRLVHAGGTPATETAGLEAASGITDGRGQFILLGVPRGAYVLRVQSSQPATTPGGRPIPISAELPLVVGNADVADVLVTTRAGATVSGRVEVHGAQPIAASALSLVMIGLDSGAEVRIDQNYRFSVTLPPGRYLVLVESPVGTCVSKSGGKEVSDERLVVADQNVSDVVVSCGDPSATLSGTVRDDRGQIDQRTQVILFPTERRFWSGAEYRQRRNLSILVTAGGRYRTSDLPPGEYFVVALPDGASDNWQLAAFREFLIPSAARITLGAGESRALDLRTAVIR
jgi:hypothetical protein